MRKMTGITLLVMLALIAGCATSPPQEPQVQGISAEELERIMPKPVPNLTLDEIVQLSKQGATAEQIIEKIKASNSSYDLTPSQSLGLNKHPTGTNLSRLRIFHRVGPIEHVRH